MIVIILLPNHSGLLFLMFRHRAQRMMKSQTDVAIAADTSRREVAGTAIMLELQRILATTRKLFEIDARTRTSSGLTAALFLNQSPRSKS